MSTVPLWLPIVVVTVVVIVIVVGSERRRSQRWHRAMNDYRRSPHGEPDPFGRGRS